jgi:hypothetical protein
MAPELRAAKDDDAKRFVGRYHYSGGEKEVKARDEAIDGVVSEMNFLVRSIARSRLKASTPITAALRITSTPQQLTVSIGALSYTGPLNGRSVKVVGITGDELDMHYRVSAKRLEQIFKGERGGRVNTFTRNGATLGLSVRVFSPKLPKELRYKLSYRLD